MKHRNITLTILVMLLFHKAYSNDTLFIKVQSDVDLINQNVIENSVIKFGTGTFYVPRLVFTHAVELLGEGTKSVLKPAKSGIPVLIQAKSDITLKKIVIDGDRRSSVGVYANGDIKVFFCNIQNFRGDKIRSGIGLRATGSLSKLIVQNSIIRNIDGFEDKIEGNSIGANRGIYSNANYVRISNTKFENIVGKEDGDAVHLQTKKNSDLRWSSSNGIIENCDFINFGKRAIKLASSNNIIKNCYFIRSDKDPASTAISIYGDYNSIVQSTFEIAVDVAWITFSGARFTTLEGNKINMIKTSRLFYVTQTSATTIRNNEFTISNPNRILTGFSPNTDKFDFSDITSTNRFIYTK